MGKKDNQLVIVGFVEDHGENVRSSVIQKLAEKDAYQRLSEAVENKISTMSEIFTTTTKISSKEAERTVSQNVLRGAIISKKYWQRVQTNTDERIFVRAWAQLTIDATKFKKLIAEAMERSASANAKVTEQQEKEFFEKAERIWNEF